MSYGYSSVSAHGISSALDENSPEEWKATYDRYQLWLEKGSRCWLTLQQSMTSRSPTSCNRSPSAST